MAKNPLKILDDLVGVIGLSLAAAILFNLAGVTDWPWRWLWLTLLLPIPLAGLDIALTWKRKSGKERHHA